MAGFSGNETILVTGATGNINSLVIPQLLKRGVRLRALAHSVDKAKALSASGVEVVVGEFEDRETLDRAFKGVGRAFLITPANPRADVFAENLIAAAKRSGNPYLVRLSVLRAAEDGPTDNVRQHARAEKALKESGLPFAILRPHFFMQNFFMSAQTIASEGAFAMGFGEGRLGLIDVRDIADSAVAVLSDKGHAGKVYELTGPASVTLHEVASVFSTAMGREVRYVPVSPESVGESLRKMGMGDWFAQVMTDYSKAYAGGWGDLTTDNVRRLTGHEARSVEAFAREVLAPRLTGAAQGEAAS
jgi:uncharacterized protein YbjT (DUF2867 family)